MKKIHLQKKDHLAACGNHAPLSDRVAKKHLTSVIKDVTCKSCMGTKEWTRQVMAQPMTVTKIEKGADGIKATVKKSPEFTKALKGLVKGLEGVSIFSPNQVRKSLGFDIVCGKCGGPILMMVAKGTNYCSSNCAEGKNKETT